MRLGFNGLYGLVRNGFAMDPESGHLFLFSNARRDRMKVLFFDGIRPMGMFEANAGGPSSLAQPDKSGDKVQLSREEFALLVGGIDLAQTRPRKWYRKSIGEEPSQLRKSA